uniref:DNA-directed DNA polymerase n=1 Tax=Plectus sambesii TaxID=2011161 RepID=A0A914WY06_9BILA
MPYQYLDRPEKLDNTIDSLVLADFNDDLHGVNDLEEPATKYLDTLEVCNFDESSALAKLGISKPPSSGEQRLHELKQMLASKGIVTVRQMVKNYLEHGVRPFCLLIGKILNGWFRVINNDVIQHYPTLPSLAFESALRHNNTHIRIPLFSLDIDTARLFESASGGLSGRVSDVGGQRLAIVPEADAGDETITEDESNPEFRCGRYIAENWFGRDAARIRSLHAFDINSCYGSILGQKLPHGQYRVRQHENNAYQAEYYGTREHLSYLWLQFESMLLGHTLRSKWTSPGEQLMVVEDTESGKQVYYRLDGYCKLETSPGTYEHYGYEYNECHSTRNQTEYNGLYLGNNSLHRLCDSCQIEWQQANKSLPKYLEKKRKETDNQLQNLVEAELYMKTVWSCTLIEILNGSDGDDDDSASYCNAFRHFAANFNGYNFDIARRNYHSKEDIIQDVMNKDIKTGWMLVDAHVQRRHRLDFFDLPPLYAKRVVTPDDVGPVTMEYLARSNTQLSKDPLLVGTFSVDKYLMNFEIVRHRLCLGAFILSKARVRLFEWILFLRRHFDRKLYNIMQVDTDGMIIAFGTTNFRDSCKPSMQESYDATIDSLLENKHTKNTTRSLGLFKEERLRRCVVLTTKGYATQLWIDTAPDIVRFRGISSKHYDNWRQLHYEIFEREFKGDNAPPNAMTAQITTSFGQYITLLAQRTGITKAVTKKRVLGLHGVYCVPFDLYHDEQFRANL